MKWVIKYKDGEEVHHYRHEKFNKDGEWLGNGDIMFFDTEQKAKDFLKTLDSREFKRWVEIEIHLTEEEEIERDREREMIKEVEEDLKENNPQYAIK